MAGILDMARDLGGALARTDEYQALRRALLSADDDRELVTMRNEIEKLEAQIAVEIRSGREPTEEMAEEYNASFSRLQASSTYQMVVAAQANFDKVLMRVNETISTGIEEGATSRIVLSS